jgi:hypothetical protein
VASAAPEQTAPEQSLAPAAPPADPAADSAVPQTVRMKRDPDLNAAPHTADVHPDEVANMQAAGWQIAE